MQSKSRKVLKGLDWITLSIILVLVAFGMLAIANATASPFSGGESGLSDYIANFNMDYLGRQAVNIIIGLIVMFVIIAIDDTMFKAAIKPIYFIICGLLLILWLIGDTTRGIAGWFQLLGDRAFQPAEVCKIVMIILLARFASEMTESSGGVTKLRDIVKLVAYTAVPFVLIILQPDFGTALAYPIILLGIMFVAKINYKYVIGVIVAIAAAAPVTYLYLLNDDQRARINVFLDPSLDPTDKGYNVTQSKIAIGSGQLTGKGFFQQGSLAQLKYVPERQTDFIFSVTVEAIGFIGGVILILLYFALIFRIIYLAYQARDSFGTYMLIGVAMMFSYHVIENIGMTVGMLPVTGIPLPFLSYGGSNMLTNMAACGLVLNVAYRRPNIRR